MSTEDFDKKISQLQQLLDKNPNWNKQIPQPCAILKSIIAKGEDVDKEAKYGVLMQIQGDFLHCVRATNPDLASMSDEELLETKLNE